MVENSGAQDRQQVTVKHSSDTQGCRVCCIAGHGQLVSQPARTCRVWQEAAALGMHCSSLQRQALSREALARCLSGWGGPACCS